MVSNAAPNPPRTTDGRRKPSPRLRAAVPGAPGGWRKISDERWEAAGRARALGVKITDLALMLEREPRRILAKQSQRGWTIPARSRMPAGPAPEPGEDRPNEAPAADAWPSQEPRLEFGELEAQLRSPEVARSEVLRGLERATGRLAAQALVTGKPGFSRARPSSRGSPAP